MYARFYLLLPEATDSRARGAHRVIVIFVLTQPAAIHSENSRIDRPTLRGVNCIVSDGATDATAGSAIKEEDLDWLRAPAKTFEYGTNNASYPESGSQPSSNLAT